jgi:sulfatase maturation enzyme AslB (radical SAM superfamily)
MLKNNLHHLYINPLERCNLRCKICYTKKTDAILDDTQIVDFIKRYNNVVPLSSVTFCGGEVFTLPYFTNLVNTLTDQGIFISIITNGTVDRLNELANTNSINLIVSIDGLPAYHDKNRGIGNFAISVTFLQKAHAMGFHTEIFSIVTADNHDDIHTFEKYMNSQLNSDISITYHPRKPRTYLSRHPVSNIVGTVKGFDFLTHEQMKHLLRTKKTFPPKELGCYQISLMSNGLVYGCCEGTVPLGTIRDDIKTLMKRLEQRLTGCLACSQPDFVCGIKNIINLC